MCAHFENILTYIYFFLFGHVFHFVISIYKHPVDPFQDTCIIRTWLTTRTVHFRRGQINNNIVIAI